MLLIEPFRIRNAGKRQEGFIRQEQSAVRCTNVHRVRKMLHNFNEQLFILV